VKRQYEARKDFDTTIVEFKQLMKLKKESVTFKNDLNNTHAEVEPEYSDFFEPKIREEDENPYIPNERYTGVDMRLN
jgi:hypothetical protein